jgi:hypothetical protein
MAVSQMFYYSDGKISNRHAEMDIQARRVALLRK